MHTFEGNVIAYSSQSYYENLITYPDECYVKQEIGDNLEYYKLTIYNSNFSVNNVQLFNMPTPPTGYVISNFSITQKVFNNDDNYEYLMIFRQTDGSNMDSYNKMVLYDHNYNVIKNFGSATSISSSDVSLTMGRTYVIDGNRVFTITKRNSSNETSTEIYYILGVDNISENIVESSKVPFPNPANQIINIPCERQQDAIISIFDINGKLIESKQVNCGNEGFLLDVTNYPSGIYIYECDGKRNRFIKQ